MNKVLALVFIFFCINSAFAQPFEWNDQQGQYTEVNTVHFLSNGKWLIGGEYENVDDWTRHPYMQIFDSTGTIWGKNGDGFINQITHHKEWNEQIFELSYIQEDVFFIQSFSLEDSFLVNIEHTGYIYIQTLFMI